MRRCGRPTSGSRAACPSPSSPEGTAASAAPPPSSSPRAASTSGSPGTATRSARRALQRGGRGRRPPRSRPRTSTCTTWPARPRAVEELADELGGLDAFVNNAGYGSQTPFLEMELAEWQGVIDVNLTGAFVCAQTAAKRLVAAGRRRADRQRHLRPRAHPARGQRAVHGVEARPRRADEGHGARARRARHHRQRGRPRADRHAHDRAGGPGARTRATASPSAAPGRPTRSPRSWPSSARTGPRTSPARPTSSTAAWCSPPHRSSSFRSAWS